MSRLGEEEVILVPAWQVLPLFEPLIAPMRSPKARKHLDVSVCGRA
jgi:hypothetical protein